MVATSAVRRYDRAVIENQPSPDTREGVAAEPTQPKMPSQTAPESTWPTQPVVPPFVAAPTFWQPQTGVPLEQGVAATAGIPTPDPHGSGGSVGWYFTQIFAAFGIRQVWVRAAQLAGVAFAAAFVGALFVLLSSGNAMNPVGEQVEANINDVGRIVAAALQVVGLGFGGPLTLALRGGILGIQLPPISIVFQSAPLFVPLLAAVALWVFMQFRPLAAGITAAQKVAMGVAAGVIFATTMTLLSGVFPLRISGQSSGLPGSLSVSSASFAGWAVAFFAIALFVCWRDGGPLQLPRPWAAALTGAFVHLGGLVLLGLIGVIILAFTHNPTHSSGPSPLALVPFWGITAAVWVMVLSLFGSVELSTTGIGGDVFGLGSLKEKMHELAPVGESISVTSSAMPSWAPALLLGGLVLAVAAAVVVYLRGGADKPMALLRSAVIWAALGLVIWLGAGVGVSITKVPILAPSGASVSFGPTGATVFVLLFWGAVVSAIALWVAPYLVVALPTGLVAFVQRGIPAAAPDMPATSAGGPQVLAKGPLAPGAKKGLIIGGAIVGLVIAVAVVLPIIRGAIFGPAATVRAYLSALEQGQATKALGFTGQEPAKGVSGALLNDAAYAAATDRPTNIGVGKVSVDGDIASVDVTYTQGEVSRKARLTATRTGTSWLIADEWRLKDPVSLETVIVENESDLEARTLTIGGVDIPMDNPEMRFSALPGTYKVTVKGTEMMKEGEGVVHANGSKGKFAFEDVPSEMFVTKAIEATNERINACAAKTSAYLGRGCPFSLYQFAWSSAPTVTYKVVRQPTLSLSHNQAKGWQVTSTASGRYSYSYTSSFGTTGSEQDFQVRARVRVGGGNTVDVQGFD